MATLTATAAAASGPVRAIHAGMNVISATYDGSTDGAFEASAQTVLMCKVPHGARIHEVIADLSTGAASCPWSVGLHSYGGTAADPNAFASSSTLATAVLRYGSGVQRVGAIDISCSEDTAVQYTYVTATATNGTATTGCEINVSVFYTVGEEG